MIHRRFFLAAACCTVALSTTAFTASAQQTPVSISRFNGLAIDGSDTVAYHDMYAQGVHQHQYGKATFAFDWNGATWHFASAESRDRFAAEPEKYAPPYGGHCSNALSLGEGLIRTNGKVWEFFGDNLYLFYAERGRQR